MILVLYSIFSDNDNKIPPELFTGIPEKARQQIGRYRFIKDQKACLIGKLLIRKGITYLGLGSEYDLDSIAYTEYNKPYFSTGNLHFNISHSHFCVVCAMSVHCSLGIDVEHIRPVSIEDFTSHMAPAELDLINSSPTPMVSFYRYWTQKECVIKADGKGLGIPLKDFIITEGETSINDNKWFVQEIQLADNYICNLATNANGRELSLQIVEEKIL